MDGVSRHGRIGRFFLHYFEMCVPMCIGFAIGDIIHFAVAGSFGYSEPFGELLCSRWRSSPSR
jgi:hypothetical protein